MSEWKGLWKCETCGVVLPYPTGHHRPTLGEHGFHCDGPMKPYDRRVPDPRQRQYLDLAFEAGYLACGRGQNLQKAYEEFYGNLLRLYEEKKR